MVASRLLGEPLSAQQTTFDALWTVVEGTGLQGCGPTETLRIRPRLSNDTGHPLAPFGEELVLGEKLGSGGMGVVFAAEQRSLRRTVAVKRLKAGASPLEAQALVREALHTGQLEHPNIVPVYALGTDEQGRPTMVMKSIDGVSWHQLLSEPDHPLWAAVDAAPDPIARQIEVALQVCRAAHFANRRGILHRDIKPENVMLGWFGEVYLVDWGIALAVGARVDLTRLSGTPAYMPPESLVADASLGPWGEVYLLCGTLYTALTLELPHAGTTLKEVLASATAAAGPEMPPHWPQELTAILRKGLSARPEDRFQSVAELMSELSRHLRHRGAHKLIAASTASLEDGAAHDALFGFQQALAQWPEAPAAREGMVTVLRVMVQTQMQNNEVDGAESSLSRLRQLSDVDPALDAQVIEARVALDALQRRMHDIDPRVSRADRVWYFHGMVFGMTAVTLLQWPAFSPTSWHLLGLSLSGLVVASVALAARRESLLQASELNRKIALLQVFGGALILVNRFGSALAARGPGEVLAMDMSILAIAALAGGLFVRRFLLDVGMFYLILVLPALIWPTSAAYLFTLACLLSIVRIRRIDWDAWEEL